MSVRAEMSEKLPRARWQERLKKMLKKKDASQ